MDTYKFNGCSFDTQDEMLDALAYEWWTAHGENSLEQIDNDFAASTDGYEEARECIEGFGLEEEHMTFNGYSEADLAEAILRFWQTRPDKMESNL